MSNIFFGLNIGRSALITHQTALDVTGNNLANVNTDGYSRQRVHLTPALSITTSQGNIGTGVNVEGVERLQLGYIERQLVRASNQNGYDTTMARGFDELETVLGEPSSTGLGTSLTEFWNSWDALAARPTDAALRAQTLDRAQHLVDVYNQKNADLGALQDRFDEAARDALAQVNTWTSELAELNASIAKSETGGNPANDLRDQRDRLVRELSGKLGLETETDGAYLNLKFPDGGPYVVHRVASYELTGVDDPNGYLTDLHLKSAPVTPKGGELAAFMELRDRSVPDLQRDVTGWMATVVNQVNSLHAEGTDRDGNAGRPLFRWGGSVEQVSYAASSGLGGVSNYATLETGTHRLEVTSVDGLATVARGTLTAGSIGLTATLAPGASFSTAYTGATALNQDYHVRAVAADRVQLYRGDEAVGSAQVVGTGGTGTVSWSVDGVTFQATVTNPAGGLVAGERSDGWLTVGQVSLDGGPPVGLDVTVAPTVTLTTGTAMGYLGGGTADVTFSGDPVTGGGITAYGTDGALSLDAVVAADTDKLAVGYDPSGTPGGGNGENARRIADLAVQNIFEGVGETAAGFLGRVVQTLGSNSRDAQVLEEASSSAILQLEAQRESVSGVNVDEEMIHLIQFQRGYEAAARFLTTIDGMIDTLVNRVGLVGR